MNVTIADGVSPTAGFVRTELGNCERWLQASAAFGIEHAIRGELADVWEECSRPDWDGYGALPVTRASYRYAARFLRAMPLGFPIPSIGAEPDGQMTFEWARSARRRLSLSFSPEGDVHYAALLGAGRTCGSTPFFGEIPEFMRSLIRQVS